MNAPRIAPPPEKLSLNTATVKAQWRLDEIIEGCARHGIRGISPWRDQVAAIGLARAAQLIRNHGLTVTGYCRGDGPRACAHVDDDRHLRALSRHASRRLDSGTGDHLGLGADDEDPRTADQLQAAEPHDPHDVLEWLSGRTASDEPLVGLEELGRGAVG